jgi:hypothetical protein
MGAKSKQYIKSLGISMRQADTDVMRCQQFLIGIEGSREGMDKALEKIVAKMTHTPAKTFEEVAKTDPEVAKAGATYERCAKELEDYKTKFTATIQEAAFSIGQAQTVITNFGAFCDEKAKTWNPLKKKSLSKSRAALTKANTDLAQLKVFLDGIEDHQRQKGNIT